MALVFENVNSEHINNLSYAFKDGFITALVGKNSSAIIDILTMKTGFSGTLELNSSSFSGKLISVVGNETSFYTNKVKEEFRFLNECYRIDEVSFYDNINKYIEMFGFDSSFMNRVTYTLSETERIIINIIKKLIVPFAVIIFDDIFKYLDYKYSKILKTLMNNLKVNGKIVIVKDDINKVQMIANEILIIGDDGMNTSGSMNEISTNVDLLSSYGIKAPCLSLITHKAKVEKKVNINYHKDVRDIIKDIYKHV